MAAAAGGGFEIEGDALVLGAAAPELAHGIDVEAGPGSGRGSAEVGQRAFDVGRERVPGQLAQFGQRFRYRRRHRSRQSR